jgi:ribosomal protein S18 acetylase RimI-like enzyme
MSGNVLVRAIKDNDIDAVVELWREAGLLRPWNDPLKDIAFARAHDQSVVLVAVDASAIVGTAMVGQDGHRGWVYYVAAHPGRNGQGIGRVIMDAAEHWLSDRGIWKVQILVRSDNDQAKGFYERLGYVDTQSTCLQKVIGAPV